MREFSFTLRDLRAAVPEHCFQPSTARSLVYLAGDVALLATAYTLLGISDSWALRPLLWFWAGTALFSLYVIGHDCGHGSFSRHRWLNDLVGHVTNTIVLVPYHAWRLSHRIHHRHVGDVEFDETWYPLTESLYRAMPWYARAARFHLIPLAFPLYLIRRTWGRTGSHFDPWSELFRPSERRIVATSVACCAVALAAFGVGAVVLGPRVVADYYLCPYLVFVIWLDVVTYLHHTSDDLPWYRGKAWTRLRGALSTIDRDYGLFKHVHHHIGTHVAHHLFPAIPHYRLREATRALRPTLGEHYRVSDEPLWRAFWRSARSCRVVPDSGEVVFARPRLGAYHTSQRCRSAANDEMVGLSAVATEKVMRAAQEEQKRPHRRLVRHRRELAAGGLERVAPGEDGRGV